MSTEIRNAIQNRSRWLRVGLLTYTLASPFITALFERLRQSSQPVREQAAQVDLAQSLQKKARTVQKDTINRLDDLTAESRRLVAEQVRQLQKQSRQLEKLTRQLRKKGKKQAKQRRKYLEQVRKTGSNWSQELAERSGKVIEQSSKVAQDLVERGSKATSVLTERGSKASQDLVKRSNKATKKLARRSSKVAQDLADRSSQLLEPVRKQGKATRAGFNFWTIFGFSLGIFAAAIVTYLFVRRRLLAKELEELEQQIELPQGSNWNGTNEPSRGRPAGEIRRVDDIGTAVATMPVVDVEQMQRPTDANYIGVVSTRLYYPVDIELDVVDLIYFVSEEEAQNQGFTAAQ